LSSTIITLATGDDSSFVGDASSPKVRIDDAMSPIRDESRKRYDRDAIREFPKDDDFRHEISAKVDCSDDQK